MAPNGMLFDILFLDGCHLTLYYLLLKSHETRVFAAELQVLNIDTQKEQNLNFIIIKFSIYIYFTINFVSDFKSFNFLILCHINE